MNRDCRHKREYINSDVCSKQGMRPRMLWTRILIVTYFWIRVLTVSYFGIRAFTVTFFWIEMNCCDTYLNMDIALYFWSRILSVAYVLIQDTFFACNNLELIFGHHTRMYLVSFLMTMIYALEKNQKTLWGVNSKYAPRLHWRSWSNCEVYWF